MLTQLGFNAGNRAPRAKEYKCARAIVHILCNVESQPTISSLVAPAPEEQPVEEEEQAGAGPVEMLGGAPIMICGGLFSTDGQMRENLEPALEALASAAPSRSRSRSRSRT